MCIALSLILQSCALLPEMSLALEEIELEVKKQQVEK